jgi:aminoglycoside phosphotransferase (APT) family kinase protein
MDPERTVVQEALGSRRGELGERLGAGVEGTVYALGDDLVAKAWRGRSAVDLQALRRFTEAVEAAGLPFATPVVLEVVEGPETLLVSIERRLHGVALRPDGQDAPPPATAQERAVMTEVLEALAAVAAPPAMSALPLLPGDGGEDGSFPVRLADLVERRTTVAGDPIRTVLPGVDGLAAAAVGRLRGLVVPAPGLVHGDLIPANVLVQGGHVSAVLDFGFLTAGGDPRFDAAVTASVFDMYGPHARASERALDSAFADRFGYDDSVLALYRGAYALATATWFGAGPHDGHFRWCLRVLARPEVLAALS